MSPTVPAYVVSVHQLYKQFIPPWYRQVSTTADHQGKHDDLLRPMAAQATEFANKRGIDWNMFVKVEPASLKNKKGGNQLPIDYRLFVSTPKETMQDDLLTPMAVLAAEFAKKRGADWDLFTNKSSWARVKPEGLPIDYGMWAPKGGSAPMKPQGLPIDYGLWSPTSEVAKDDLLRPMAAQAAEFAKKRGVEWGMYVKYEPVKGSNANKVPIDYGIFVLTLPSDDKSDDLLRPMAQKAAEFFNKKGIDFGVSPPNLSNVGSAIPPGYPMTTPPAASTSMRPKDDFTPTPGQTASHPYIKFFEPEMAAEFAAIVNKIQTKPALPDPALQMRQDFEARKYANDPQIKEPPQETTQSVPSGSVVQN